MAELILFMNELSRVAQLKQKERDRFKKKRLLFANKGNEGDTILSLSSPPSSSTVAASISSSSSSVLSPSTKQRLRGNMHSVGNNTYSNDSYKRVINSGGGVGAYSSRSRSRGTSSRRNATGGKDTRTKGEDAGASKEERLHALLNRAQRIANSVGNDVLMRTPRKKSSSDGAHGAGATRNLDTAFAKSLSPSKVYRSAGMQASNDAINANSSSSSTGGGESGRINLSSNGMISYTSRMHNMRKKHPFDRDGGVFSNGSRYDWRVINKELSEEERSFARVNTPTRVVLDVLLI